MSRLRWVIAVRVVHVVTLTKYFRVKKTMKRLQTSILAAFFSLSLCACTALQQSADIDVPTRAKLAQISVNADGGNFHYWNKNAPAFQKLTTYVKAVTDPASPDFIPAEDRIAVFDLDGTLICETTPSYFEWMLYLERVLNDPDYKPTPKEKALTILA